MYLFPKWFTYFVTLIFLRDNNAGISTYFWPNCGSVLGSQFSSFIIPPLIPIRENFAGFVIGVPGGCYVTIPISRIWFLTIISILVCPSPWWVLQLLVILNLYTPIVAMIYLIYIQAIEKFRIQYPRYVDSPSNLRIGVIFVYYHTHSSFIPTTNCYIFHLHNLG